LVAGLLVDTQNVYQGHIEWSGHNETVVDKLWDDFDVDVGSIALTYEYAAQNGLVTDANEYPWDNTKGMYYVRAFHDMHCLVRIAPLFSMI
jgi:hypothetical protein